MQVGITREHLLAPSSPPSSLAVERTFERTAVRQGGPRSSIRFSISNLKKANLAAARRERIRLPSTSDGKEFKSSSFGEFMCQPSGVEAVLNTNALQSFQPLDDNTYRCTLQEVRLLGFEATPVLDLRVTPDNKSCTVELLSCRFEGSEFLERQNDHFEANMTNHMTWNVNGTDAFLEVDVKVNLILEIYTQPFTLLPSAAVEIPGNLMIKTLLDTLVPLLLQQLVRDYKRWARQQLDGSI